ncbi:MAG: ATP-binding cassette domain-containing protein [Clostridia bacterium]|nr:ATP-binding cassette domain-containing protein [Clostridia bacterium]
MDKKLQVNNLTISFRTQAGKVQAVRDISFDLEKGETLAIVGESGSGKSVTSKAIMGISAVNAIVESGEIIYDGKDLLKISEEEMVKLRGDKIAMIFQDPMSSLNPIMRIGRQLTEAMLLKAKASMRNARTIFNAHLKLLNKNLDEALGESEKENNRNICKTFDEFCINSAKLESAYNKIHRTAVELKLDLEHALFLVSKNHEIDERKVLKTAITQMPLTAHPDIVVMTDEIKNDIEELKAGLKSLGLFGKVDALPGNTKEILQKFVGILEKAIDRPKPNYFTLGYYMLKNPDANVDDLSIEDLTKLTREFLDNDFMIDFIAKGEKAVANSRQKSLDKKQALLAQLESAKEHFNNLVNFIKEYKLNQVGFFAYSREEGTRAYNFEDQVSEKVKKDRVKLASDMQYTVVQEYNNNMIGKELDVVVDYFDGEYAICRSEFQNPETDSFILVVNDNMEQGKTYNIKIVGSFGYDLEGERV